MSKVASRITVRLFWVLAAALVAGPAAGEPLAPGSTLCLHPLEIPAAKDKGEERRVAMEKKLMDALVAAAFQVPDPQTVAELGKRVRTDVGGFIDPATGRRDEARYRAVSSQLAAALRNEIHCEAQLSAQVMLVRAPFGGGSAHWDGATDAVSSTGRVLLQALGGAYESGWVAALSLWLRVYDLEDNDLAFRTAGIESLVTLAVFRDRDVLPEDVWLTDGAKIDAAILSALGPNGDALRFHGTPAGVDPVPSKRASDAGRAESRQ